MIIRLLRFGPTLSLEVFTSPCDSNNWLANIWLVTWLGLECKQSDLWNDLHLKNIRLELTCIFQWLDFKSKSLSKSSTIAAMAHSNEKTQFKNSGIQGLVISIAGVVMEWLDWY